MKKALTALCLTLTVSLVLCGCSEKRQGGDGFEIAGGENVDYTFEYPSSWEKTRDDGMIAVKSDSSPASISVTSFRPTEDIPDADAYFELYRENFEKTLGDYNEISDEEVSLGAEKAKKISYTATVMGDTYRFASVICVHNKAVYTITYTASEDDYEAHAGTLAHVIQTFEFE